MGRTGAMGMAEAVSDNSINIEAALHWHLTNNHYPPLPTSLIPVALRALKAARKEQWHRKVLMPKNLLFRGLRLAPVGNLIEALHLEDFI
jgi:hypothetical protein